MPASAVSEHRIGQAREHLVGRTEVRLVRGIETGLRIAEVDQVVIAAVDGTQAEGHANIRQDIDQILAGGIALGDLDLIQNKVEIAPDELDANPLLILRMVDKGRQRRRSGRDGNDRLGRRREHLLGDAVVILEDRAHAQGEPAQGKGRVDREG